jgi:hypothetical protein
MGSIKKTENQKGEINGNEKETNKIVGVFIGIGLNAGLLAAW